MSYQIPLDQDLIVDNFAGGGGASTGIEMALDRPVNIAINHDPTALSMHEINHPLTTHYCEDVWDINPKKVCNGRQVSLAWVSPDCKHFSKAKGGRPVEKKIRGLAWVVLRWASLKPEEGKPRVIFIENVEEFITWGPLTKDNKPDPKQKGRTFNAFKNALRRHGYTNIEHSESRASDYGAGTIRKRLMLIARCDGGAIIWPSPTHGDPKKIKGTKLKPWVTAAECIDWSIPCTSIFSRKRPLAENTLKRISKGMKKFVIDSAEPFIVTCNHQGEYFRGQGINEPFKTICASRDAHGIVLPYLTEHANASTARVFSAEEPLRTQCAMVKGGHFALCTAFLTQHNGRKGGYNPGRSADKPLSTLTMSGTQQQIVTSHIMKMRGQNIGQPSHEPLHTASAGGQHHALVNAFMVKYFGTDQDPRLDAPLHTVTTKDRFGIVHVESSATNNLTEEQRYNAWWTIRFLEDYNAIPVVHGFGIDQPSILMLGDYIMHDIGMRMSVSAGIPGHIKPYGTNRNRT